MNLQPDECDQFYRIWWSLLSYVNKQMKLFNDFPSQLENDNIKQQDAAVIRNALWASDRLLQDFIDSNPDNLSDADLELAASWKNRVADLEAYFSACDNKAKRVSFKRLVKFLCDSDRIGWEETERMEKFLKLQ
jgi:hypothetical protein